MPKRVKYRRVHRGRMTGKAMRGNTITYGEYGLVAQEPGWLTSNQTEAARIAITRYTHRGGQVSIKMFPDQPLTDKPSGNPRASGNAAPHPHPPPGQSPHPESSSQSNPPLRPSSRRTTSAGTIARHPEVLSETICLPVHRPAPPFSYPELPASEGIPIYALHQNGTFQYRFNTISIIFRYEI